MNHQYDGKQYEISLEDEGTLDTVLMCQGVIVRYGQDAAADYRDSETGGLDLKSFLEEFGDAIVEESFDVLEYAA